MDRVTKDGKTLLDKAPEGVPCHYIDEGKGIRGYLLYSAAEIAAHQAWLDSLPAKRERRALAAAQRRRDELIKLKDDLEAIPAEETRAEVVAKPPR